MSSVPQPWLSGCAAAQRRLDAVVGRLTDDLARRPSLLPDWTVGHLLTHLARNADSHRGMVEAAQRGEMIAQYPGGRAERERGIAEGFARPAAELAADVIESHRRIEAAWAATDEETWATGLGLRRNGPATIAESAFLRWREVEVHLVDLGLAELGCPDWDGISPEYLDGELGLTMAELGPRLPEDVTLVLVPGDRPSRAFGSGERRVVVRAPAARILGCLLGRGGDPSWPALGPWG